MRDPESTGTSYAVLAELSEEERRTVVEGLVRYNAEQGRTWERDPLHVVARRADRTVGGLIGEINHGWLFVNVLWVHPEARSGGVGSELMSRAEAEAGRRGCVGVYLDTYSFQARPFYEKIGYSLFGELPDCPPGGARYYFAKRLTPR